MNKNISKILLLALGVIFLLLPLLTSADGLVPCGGPEGPECNVCHLLVLLQNVIKFGIQMASLVVIGSIVYGGFRWILSGGNQAQIQAGQKAIMGAIIGFIIILSAWLIVNTVFWLIAQAGGSDEYTGNWYKIECDTSSALPAANGSSDNNNNGDNSGNNGQGNRESWCSDMIGGTGEEYACVRERTDCTGATVILVNEPTMHCPSDAPVCCIPSDESKIVAKPTNPEPPNLGGPCEDSQLMELCPNFSACRTHPSCWLKQHPELQPSFCVKVDKRLLCPEDCPHHECDSDSECNK